MDNKVINTSTDKKTGSFDTDGTGGTQHVGVQGTVVMDNMGRQQHITAAGSTWTTKDGAPVSGNLSGTHQVSSLVDVSSPNTNQSLTIMAPDNAPVRVGAEIYTGAVNPKTGEKLSGSQDATVRRSYVGEHNNKNGGTAPIVVDSTYGQGMDKPAVETKARRGVQVDTSSSVKTGLDIKDVSTGAAAVEQLAPTEGSVANGGLNTSGATEKTSRGVNAVKSAAEGVRVISTLTPGKGSGAKGGAGDVSSQTGKEMNSAKENWREYFKKTGEMK